MNERKLETMEKSELAREYFFKGYNCAQSVAAAFADILPIAREHLLAASRPLGGGIGRLREMCGTVAAAAMCLGMLFPDISKNDIYALVQEHAYKFREKNKTFLCGELLNNAGLPAETEPVAEPRTPEYYEKRPCPQLVYDAAAILEEMLIARGVLQA